MSFPAEKKRFFFNTGFSVKDKRLNFVINLRRGLFFSQTFGETRDDRDEFDRFNRFGDMRLKSGV